MAKMKGKITSGGFALKLRKSLHKEFFEFYSKMPEIFTPEEKAHNMWASFVDGADPNHRPMFGLHDD